MTGPLAGAGVYKMLEVFINRHTEYWQLFLGLILIALVVLFPKGLVGFIQARFQSKLAPSAEEAA